MNDVAEELRSLAVECTDGAASQWMEIGAIEIDMLEERIKGLEAGDCRFHCRSRKKE